MNPSLVYAEQVIAAIATLLKTGQDVAGFVAEQRARIAAMQSENRDPSDAEWAALRATIDDLRGRLHAEAQAASAELGAIAIPG